MFNHSVAVVKRIEIGCGLGVVLDLLLFSVAFHKDHGHLTTVTRQVLRTLLGELRNQIEQNIFTFVKIIVYELRGGGVSYWGNENFQLP